MGGVVTGNTLSPERLVSGVSVSNATMVQNPSVEAAFRSSIAKSIMARFEKNLLADEDYSAGPASIFASAGSGSTAWTASGAIGALAACQAKLFGNGVENNARIAVLMNADAYQDLMQNAGADFTGGYLDLIQRRVATMPYYVSSNVGYDKSAGAVNAKAHALVLDVNSVHLAMFGGLDMLEDPYTNASYGGTRLITNALVDGLAVQTGATGRQMKVVSSS